MAQRYLLSASTTVFVILMSSVCFSTGAPAFKFKKIFSGYEQERYPPPPRVERRLVSGASPIHFITPFMGGMPMTGFRSYFAPQASLGNPASSSVYKLPLRLYNNGKPHTVFHGVPKPQNVIDYLPQAVSNIIRLPLKYMSNAKPVGVYFKDPSFNFL